MDNLNNIPNAGNWGDAASKLNDNFNKVRQAVTTVENTSKNNKGYFTSLSALNTAFPSPKAGQTAYVYDEASSTNYYIYNAVNGAWVASSIEAPSVGVDLAEYTKTGGSTKTTKYIDDTKANHGYDSSPKTLKEVEDKIAQLSDSVDEQFNWFSELGYVGVEGGFSTSNGYRRTDYIPLGDWLSYSTTVRLQVSHIAFFNKDKEFISAIPGSGTEVFELKTERLTSADYPEGAAYFIASKSVNYVGTLKFDIPDVINEKANHGYDSSPKTLKEVEDKIAQLSDSVDEQFNTTSIFTQDAGRAINSETGKVFGSTNYRLHSLYVKGLTGKRISVKIRHTSDVVCAIAFYNSETISTDTYMVGESIAGSTGLKTYETIIPTGAVLVVISHSYSQGEDPLLNLPFIPAISTNVESINGKVNALKSEVTQLAYVKIKNEIVNGNFENGSRVPFSKTDGQGGESTLAINSSTPISGNYDIRLTIITPATESTRPLLYGLNRAGNIGDKIYLHFYAKILSGIPTIEGINNGIGSVTRSYGGDVINGRNTRIIDVVGTGDNLGVIYFDSLSVWDMQMDNFMRINLTETFGAGNEPTEEEMDLLLDMLPVDYFEGEITIPAQKIMQWRLALTVDKTELNEQFTEQFNWFTELGYVDVEGKFSTSSGYKRTDYIPLGDWLSYSTTVRLAVSHIAFFNKDKEFISAIPGSGTEVFELKTERLTSADYPEGAAYFIASKSVHYAGTLKFNIPDAINSKSNDTASQFGSEKFFSNVLPENKIIYASHFAGILRRSPRLLPEMSIWSLQAANRAGFKYVQCNAAKTSDGYRIMQHNIDMNRTMTDAYGNELTEETLSTDLTLEYIKSNFRYKSTNPRFRTEVLEMTEFLNLCNEYGIVPIFNNTPFSESEFDTISGIVGDAFGIFQSTRSFDRKDCRYIVYAWRGSTIDTPEEAVTLMENIGKPAIYGAYATVFTKELSVALRKAGYLCAPASVYFENHWPNVKQFADFNVTDFYCPPFEGGDVIISSDLGWSDFTTNGTEENGLIILEAGQTLSYESDESYYLGKTVLDVNYQGELQFKCCSMNPTNGSSYTYERNASSPLLQVTPSIVNDKATLVLTATKRTLINYVNFRIKRI